MGENRMPRQDNNLLFVVGEITCAVSESRMGGPMDGWLYKPCASGIKNICRTFKTNSLISVSCVCGIAKPNVEYWAS